jgi:AcrR family transcriptional regulator
MPRGTTQEGKPKADGTRFTRDAWVAEALKVLTREGYSKLRIERISRDLNVSKGSFYWHFENRDAFLHAFVDHWYERYTKSVKKRVETAGGSARERLRLVLELVLGKNLSGYDFAFDGWASHEPSIAVRVQGVYQYRWRYIRSLFVEAGFTGPELELRTRSFLGFMKFQPKVVSTKGRRLNPALLDRWIEFFTKP